MNNIRLTTMLRKFSPNSYTLRESVFTPILMASVITLGACATAPIQQSYQDDSTTSDSSNDYQADATSDATETFNENDGDNNSQASSYLKRAKYQPIQKKQSSLLNAAEFFFAANNPRDAIATLDKIDSATLTTTEKAQYDVLRAKSLGFSQRYSDSLSLLKQISLADLANNKQRAEFYSISALSEFAVGNKERAMIALLQRENYLEREEIGENQKRLWAITDLSTEAELSQIIRTTDDQALADWLELTTLVNDARSPQAPTGTYQGQYDSYGSAIPLNIEMPNYNSQSSIPSTWNSNSPQRIALLLPINSEFNSAAKAFEAGFRQASSENASFTRPYVSTYDLGSSTHAINYVDQATRNGADFIVGPLGKNAAQSILNISNPPVPIMALGGVINRPSPLLNLFTLSPEQEMAAIARHAIKRGFTKAAVLFPDSPWGQRNRDAFNQIWASANGSIVVEKTYETKSYDHSSTIKNLLSINASQSRHNRLSSTIGFKPKFTATRRSDIDFLVLIARSDSARVIKPELSFYQAHDLPTYSTSAVYTGSVDPANDADLDGIMFPEMPWLLSDLNNVDANNSRLFAFGYDAYQITPILEQLRMNSQLNYQGLSGRLSVNSYGQIVREPTFATFKNGIPEAEGGAIESLNRHEIEAPSFNNKEQVIDRSNRYDSKTWDAGTNSRKKSR